MSPAIQIYPAIRWSDLLTCWVHFATAYMTGNATRHFQFGRDLHWESNELKAKKMCLVIQTMPFAIWQNDTKIQQHHAVGAELMIPYASVHESSFYWNGLVNIKLAGQKNR